jgi:hypothetical protein
MATLAQPSARRCVAAIRLLPAAPPCRVGPVGFLLPCRVSKGARPGVRGGFLGVEIRGCAVAS